MAKLKIIKYPDPILARKAQPVSQLKNKDLRLIEDMIETMFEEDGIGLAAPQVGISKRIIVVCPKALRSDVQVYINPVIIHASEEQEIGLEGCLSVPDVSCEVRRSTKITLKAMRIDGKEYIDELRSFPARVAQHEIDHLNGILLIDRVDFNQRQALLGTYQRL